MKKVHSPLSDNPTLWYQHMRQENPIYFDPDFTFFFGAKSGWQFFNHDDVKFAFSDHQSFSNEYIPSSGGDILGASLITTDPPRHRNLHALASKAFSPSVISRLEPWIREKCRQLISPFLKSGEMDFASSVAIPLPILTLARLLGVPDQNIQQLGKWTKAITGDPTVIGMEIYQDSMNGMGTFFMELIEERAQHPQTDLITDLVLAEVDGTKLSRLEILAFCITLITAGTETTEGWAILAMDTFIQYPEMQKHLISNPEDIPKALNEVLRFRSPVMCMTRIAKQDIELKGNYIKKNDLINLWIGSANLDPAVFPNPDIFDINRDNSKVLSFGYGIHYCIGAMLAKLEMRTLYEVIFQRMRDIRLQPETVLKRVPSTIVNSYQELPILFNT
ncbi:cytochrome P450 [Pedobacter caeni]|uniref:Cytochrome P450 n=1 Tax=Pedobacter caeni TaxID=288992 RepID=A0A1M4TAE2_9SPHI|nr:cytochrome P450 [Pedobacter caeni]SHE41370.1 Cytochrome P450 [Pedobacter caeni]